MDERGGVDGVVGALEPEVTVRDAPEVVVDELDEAVERVLIARAPALREPGDLAGRVACHGPVSRSAGAAGCAPERAADRRIGVGRHRNVEDSPDEYGPQRHARQAMTPAAGAGCRSKRRSRA
jgi:hypothetical protein